MTQPPSRQSIQRLAFIRYLYEQGVQQARQPEPLSSTSVLAFHDAVELFLRLSSEHLKINLPTQVNFADYWEKLAPGLAGAKLPSKQPMDRINKLRVALKHHGTIPSATAIDQARADVTAFFTDATPMVFGSGFNQIDMIDLVSRQETAEFLRDAHTHFEANDLPTAMAGLRLAFDEMISHYAESHVYDPHERPFAFGPDLNTYRDPHHNDFRDVRAKQITTLTDVTGPIQRAMRMIALGIDYASYAQFDLLCPRVLRFIDGRVDFTVTEAHRMLEEGDYLFGRLFVIEAALQAARADSVLQRRESHRAAGNPAPGVWATAEHRTWTGPASTT